MRLGVWALLLGLCLPQAQAGMSEDALRAAFVYRFVQYTRWMPEPTQEFRYCVAGAQAWAEALKPYASKSHVLPKVRVLTLLTPPRAGQCQVLLLGFSEQEELRAWQKSGLDDATLVVGLGDAAQRAGVVVALITEPDGLVFRINNSEAKRRGLELSAQLLKLAREVK